MLITQNGEAKLVVMDVLGNAAWRASHRKIKDSVALIRDHPKAGRIPPQLESLSLVRYRQVLSGMNRLIYELSDDTIYIHVVCDARRDLQGLLMKRIVDPAGPGPDSA